MCDFHREQAWDRWLSKTSNDVKPYKEGILVYLRKIAKAESIDEFDKAVEALKESHIWGANYSKKFRSWFKNIWFSAKEVIVMNIFFIIVKLSAVVVIFVSDIPRTPSSDKNCNWACQGGTGEFKWEDGSNDVWYGQALQLL